MEKEPSSTFTRRAIFPVLLRRVFYWSDILRLAPPLASLGRSIPGLGGTKAAHSLPSLITLLWIASEFPFQTGEEAAPVAGEELALVGSGGVVDDSVGG